MNDTTATQNTLNPDHPIKTMDADRLGYSRTAELLAKAFLVNDISAGFVIGVEGSWGSGKSSLVEMSLTNLEAAPNPPSIVRFAPWLVGDRDALLQHFFAELSPAIEARVPAPQKDTARAIIKRYGQLSGGFAAAATVLKKLGVPGAELASDLFEVSGDAANDVAGKSLTQLNKDLRAQLETLDGYIVVFIDDLDRLEPKEVVEILRLVRAVADFPNIAYILAYDPDVLSHSLEKAIDVPDGRAYLEKMVQASFKIPAPMSFDLKNWLQAEADTLFFPLDTLTDQAARLSYAIEEWTDAFITTPRDVVRVINALKLYATPVRDNIDPADMVFLQILRTQHPELHAWVEHYLVTRSVRGEFGHLHATLQKRMGAELLGVLKGDTATKDAVINGMQYHVPGLSSSPSLTRDTVDVGVLFSVPPDAENAAIKARRLASPTHFRYYFAFSETAGTISDQALQHVLAACEVDQNNAIAIFKELIAEERPQGGRMAEMLLDRLIAFGPDITVPELQGLFRVLGATLDDLGQFTSAKTGESSFLRGDRHQIFGLIKHVPDDERFALLETLFGSAKSLSWLAGIVISNAMERQSEQPQSGEKRPPLLSSREFALISGSYSGRMEHLTKQDFDQTPEGLRVLQAWSLVDDPAPRFAWVERQTTTDEDLLLFLVKCATPQRTDTFKITHALNWDTIELLFENPSALLTRLNLSVADDTQTPWLRERATEFLAQLRNEDPAKAELP